MNVPLVIIDDDEDLRRQMLWALKEDYQVHLAKDRDQAIEIIDAVRPSVITLDLGLPPNPDSVVEGFRALNDILGKVVQNTGYSANDGNGCRNYKWS